MPWQCPEKSSELVRFERAKRIPGGDAYFCQIGGSSLESWDPINFADELFMGILEMSCHNGPDLNQQALRNCGGD
jgi:hypothetical protein